MPSLVVYIQAYCMIVRNLKNTVDVKHIHVLYNSADEINSGVHYVIDKAIVGTTQLGTTSECKTQCRKFELGSLQ